MIAVLWWEMVTGVSAELEEGPIHCACSQVCRVPWEARVYMPGPAVAEASPGSSVLLGFSI